MSRVLSLKEVQAYCAEMLRTIDEISTRRGLRYYLVCGSVLGAVRHGGPIPWDEDVDITVPLPELGHFCDVLDEEFVDTPYCVVRPGDRSVANNITTFPRVTLKGMNPRKMHVDIFPQIGITSDPEEQVRFTQKLTEVKTLYRDKQVAYTNTGEWWKRLGKLAMRVKLAGVDGDKELEEFQRLSPATVKRITSTDPINIEQKYKDPETIKPSHTICVYTNFMPRVSTTDFGIWRRLFVVPFNAKITGNSDIKNYTAYLVEHCGGAILQWAIDGAVMFCRNGHAIVAPDIVAETTEEYQQRENWLDNFLADCCIFEPNAKVTAGELIKAYRQWAKDNGEYEGRRGNEIYSAMIAAGYEQTKPRNIKTWLGVRLKEEFLPRLYGNYYA